MCVSGGVCFDYSLLSIIERKQRGRSRQEPGGKNGSRDRAVKLHTGFFSMVTHLVLLYNPGPVGDTTHNGLGPLISIIIREDVPQTCPCANMMEASP